MPVEDVDRFVCLHRPKFVEVVPTILGSGINSIEGNVYILNGCVFSNVVRRIVFYIYIY